MDHIQRLDPDWDYHSLTYDNYPAFYDKTVKMMEPGPTATDNPESIAAFRDRGSKLVMWHGWADQIIMPQGSIDYYNQVVKVSDNGACVRPRTASSASALDICEYKLRLAVVVGRKLYLEVVCIQASLLLKYFYVMYVLFFKHHPPIQATLPPRKSGSGSLWRRVSRTVG